MKKWFGMFIIICVILLAGTGSILGSSAANKANAGAVCEEDGFLSQVVQSKQKNYILYKNIDWEKYLIADVEKDLYQYKAVGTLHRERPYYVYCFVKEAKQYFGIEPVELEKEESWNVSWLEAEGTFLAAGSLENEILVSILGNDGRTITEYALSFHGENGEWRENVVFTLPEEHFAVCGAYEQGTLVVARDDGIVLRRDVVVEELEVAPLESILADGFEQSILTDAESTWKMYCMKETAIRYLIPVLLISAFIALLFIGRKQSHIIYHLIICSEIICVLGLLIAGYVFNRRMVEQEVMETGVETGYVLEKMKAGQRADETIETSGYWKVLKQYEDLLEDIIIVDPTEFEVLQAKTLTKKMNVLEVLGQEWESLILQTAESSKTIMKKMDGNTGNYVVASRDFTQIEPKSLLLAMISQQGIEKRVESEVSVIWNVIILLMAAITILHMLIFVFFAAKWRNFLKGMQYVAHEKQAYADRPATEDGLRSAWAPLDRIGHNMVKLRYERELMYRKFYRFVPKGMDQLIGKPEMADIEIGDHNTINGCLVHFQMENIKNVADKEYMDIMTESLGLMHQIREKYEGVFISAGGDLLKRKVFFEAGPEEALKFAVELYHTHCVKKKLENTNAIMMLHQAEYHYGISGVKDMMTPFIYCGEEKILDAYKDALAEAKVRIVVTEQTLAGVGDVFSSRYIGFISGGTTIGSMKLYEILDAYTEEKRKILLESDVHFQNGLKLFYSNDLYLARNAFNEVLKLNEQDEIARWYLFHCEHHLNKPEEEVSYGLFENMICEKKHYQS